MDRDELTEKILFFVKEEGRKLQNKLETDDKIGFLRKWSCYPDKEIILETDGRESENG